MTSSSTKEMAPRDRFIALDLVRGVAAIAVMLFHFGHYTDQKLLRGAWAAVDLFFLLSGFVIHHRYGAKIMSNMTLVEFIKVRGLRLYPLYLAGLLLGVLAMTLRLQEISIVQLSQAIALSLAGFPYPNRVSWPLTDNLAFVGSVFPFNGPSWSLFFEFGVGLAYFFTLKLCRHNPTLLSALLIGFWIFCVYKFAPINPGPFTHNFIYGFPRSVSLFFLGATAYEVYRRGYSNFLPANLVFYASAFFALLCAWHGNDVLTMYFSFILPPLIVLSGANIVLPKFLNTYAIRLGDTSYALYALHVPLYALLWDVMPPVSSHSAANVVAFAIFVFAVAMVFARADNFVRRRIQRELLSRHRTPAAQSPIGPALPDPLSGLPDGRDAGDGPIG